MDLITHQQSRRSQGMTDRPLTLVLVSTPIGQLGSGRGGGVELTFTSVLKGLADRGHHLHVVAPSGSHLPAFDGSVTLHTVPGLDQPSWQHADREAAMQIPLDGVLPQLWDRALALAADADAVLNFGYDWLPLWLTPHVVRPVFHLVSMGSVSSLMDRAIQDLARWDQRRMAFHTRRQASDFALPYPPEVVGNGFDLSRYGLQLSADGPLGWAGRVAPEKGLEDAAAVAAALGEPLKVWGLVEDPAYASRVEAQVPAGTIEWCGFQPTEELQRQLGRCRAFLNTPKWNEAYGNVVVEALACGVPVIAYDRGGPGEIVEHGVTGWLVTADDREALTEATRRVAAIDRRACRRWTEQWASQEALAGRIEAWIRRGLIPVDGTIS